MRVLLSDASGLTSRQVATVLSRKGHTVHVLSTSSIPLTRLTRHVSKVHRVPPFGRDPYLWLEGAICVVENNAFDVLLCTQEQVAIISAEAARVSRLAVHLAVPDFGALKRVFDKVSAYETLNQAGLLQPESVIVKSAAGLTSCSYLLPAYIKTPIGTASTGVEFVATHADLQRAAQRYAVLGSSDQLLVQRAINGRLLMISAVFSHGFLVAWHACLRVREGLSGGASKKSSLPLPQIREHLAKLGRFLQWHGAISLDGIMSENVVFYIDVNPRLVEPINALYSGVDLVTALTEVSMAGTSSGSETMPAGTPGVETHQFLLALLKAGVKGRLAVVQEVCQAILVQEPYKGSVEELTPFQGDVMSFIVICVLVVAIILGGSVVAEKLSQNAVSNYALGQKGWDQILDKSQETGEICKR